MIGSQQGEVWGRGTTNVLIYARCCTANACGRPKQGRSQTCLLSAVLAHVSQFGHQFIPPRVTPRFDPFRQYIFLECTKTKARQTIPSPSSHFRHRPLHVRSKFFLFSTKTWIARTTCASALLRMMLQYRYSSDVHRLRRPGTSRL